MSNNLSFDLIPTESGRRLAISGPVDLMNAAHDESSREFRRRKIGTNATYRRVHAEDGSKLTWILNAKNLGRVHDQSHRDLVLKGINGFISNVVDMASQHNAEPDPKINLLNYTPNSVGEFVFSANVAKPEAQPLNVIRLLSNTMLKMIDELHYPRRGPRELAVRDKVAFNTYYGKSGIVMPLGDDMNVRSVGREWDWASGRLELTGTNLVDGGAPLICLAGAIAIAKADTLLLPNLARQG